MEVKMDNVATVQAIYQAFGQGDVQEILARVTEDTRWGFNGGQKEVPWHGPFQGKSELPGFFQALASGVKMSRFEPKKFITQGDEVIVHLALEYTVTRTGKRVAEEQLHWWTLRDGKVARLTHFEDTAQVAAACR
jgi:ketosteroid isomerase-like protein